MRGDLVELRPATEADIEALATIRARPEVARRWLFDGDAAAAVREDLSDDDVQAFVIIHQGRVAGYIQFGEETEKMYRHASIDLYVDPALHSQGVGTDSVRTLARYLIRERGHHRLVIDPAADNAAAIRAYSKAGFKPVGVMRRYELGPDGTYHDGLLMDLLADEFADEFVDEFAGSLDTRTAGGS
jgi:aminoglycoside 6'-N-acetyltransferase